jgi:hypothetical protein
MDPKQIEVVGVDSYSGHNFIVYFSDDTFATVTAEKLAECFPDREQVPPPEED